MMAVNPKKKRDRRPIVCGTDFSDTATEAVDIAAAMARRLETRLVLVHVDQLQGSLPSDPFLLEDAISERRRELDREAHRLRDLGTNVEEKFLSGSAFDELVTAASEARGRLIIVGAVGHGLARRLLVGSVAERTAEVSPVPTLVVRPGSRLGSWIHGEHELKVLVGYDFSAASDTALDWVNQLWEIGKCQTTVLYSSWPPDEARRLGHEGRLPLAATVKKELQKDVEHNLAERVATILPSENVRTIVEAGWGNPEGYLYEMASRHHVDLIVVGTHRRRGLGRVLLGSVSRAVLHHAKVAVAVVPPTESAVRRDKNENQIIQPKSPHSR
jgi:nucleotide-binding universal stress UspA family protein